MTDSLYASLLEIADARHSVRRFSDQPVAKEDVDKILAMAKQSPFASGRRSWGIKVVDDKDMIARAVVEVDKASAALTERCHSDMVENWQRYRKNFTPFQTAPVLLVPYFRYARIITPMFEVCTDQMHAWERESQIKSIGCVGMMILLAAQSLGLGSCFVTGAQVADEALCGLFELPNNWHIGGVIPIGYPAEK